jgi:hypothetical protein
MLAALEAPMPAKTTLRTIPDWLRPVLATINRSDYQPDTPFRVGTMIAIVILIGLLVTYVIAVDVL